MFEVSAVDKIKPFPLSKDTMRRSIEKLSEKVEYHQLILNEKESETQITESCDIFKKAILICNVRYIDFILKEI